MSLVWVYAVRAGGDGAAPDVSGVDGERPRVVATETLGAVVGTVADDGFDEDGLAAAMDDLGRLERLARAHHAVVVDAAAVGVVAPVRLATVFRDDEAVVAMLRERAAEFGAALDRVRDRREWGVKVYVDPAVAPAAADPPPDGDRPGTAYLLRRKADRDRSAAGREHARAVAEAVVDAGAARAVEVRRFALQDGRLSGRAQEMLVNATFLVDEAREAEFREAVTGAGDGATVELTGPWPPFSFAVPEGS